MGHSLRLLVLLTILFTTQLSPSPSYASTAVGPILDELIYEPVVSYGSKELSMMLGGQVEMATDIPSEWVSNLTRTSYTIYGDNTSNIITCVFFNVRRSPFNDSAFRAAVARLVNRDYVAESIMDGSVSPVSTFIPPIAEDWLNTKAVAPDFDTIAARNILDTSGYTLDQSRGFRVDAWGRVVNLTILTPPRNADPGQWGIGYSLVYYLRSIGVNATHVALPDFILQSTSMYGRDFDVVVRDAPMSNTPFGLYAYLHSSRDVDWTVAYSGVHDDVLDGWLLKLWSSLDLQEAKTAAKGAQGRLAELIPYVPVYSAHRLTAVSSKMVGVVDVVGFGADNLWTYLGVHDPGEVGGGSLTRLAPGGFNTLNPLLAKGRNEWSVLQLVYSPLLYYDAETLNDVPVLAESWKIEPWTTTSGGGGVSVTFSLRKGVNWQDGVEFTSGDVKFCIDYLKNNSVDNFASVTSIVDHVDAPDDYTVVIYLNEVGYRNIYSLAWFTFLPKHIWGNVTDYAAFTPWNEENVLVDGLTKLVGQGPFILAEGNLSNEVKLHWSPTYFEVSTIKESLVKRGNTPETVTSGEEVTVRYQVRDFQGKTVSSIFGFKMTVSSTGTSPKEVPLKLENGTVVAKMDTTAYSEGVCRCEFSAYPYGDDAFTFNVLQKIKPIDTTNGVPGYPLASIALGVALSFGSLVLLQKQKKKKIRQ